jgi:radical SAM protein with 4Fe4S-binding SPASM domain
MKEPNSNSFETEAQFFERLPFLFVKENQINHFRPKFLMLQWHITNQCNLRCVHCYQNNYQTDSELSLSQIMQILDQYIQLLTKWNIRGHINITGGEPLISKNIFSLLENIGLYKHICSFAILSNGNTITDPMAKHLKELGCEFFQISIEGSQDIHDKIRGEGNLEKCITAIEILKKNKISTMVSFTSSKLNVDSFDEVVKFCRRNGVNVLWSDRYLPMGNGLEIRNELLQPAEVENFFSKMYRWHHKLNRGWFQKTELRMHRALHFLITEKQGCDCYAPYKCSAGKSLITILPNGDFVPCRRMPIVVGNVMKNTIEDIYEHSTLLKKLRINTIPYKGCEDCASWEACNGGLRCLSYTYHGNPFMADPQCFKKYSILPDINRNAYI